MERVYYKEIQKCLILLSVMVTYTDSMIVTLYFRLLLHYVSNDMVSI
jgi:hypothetical protein